MKIIVEWRKKYMNKKNVLHFLLNFMLFFFLASSSIFCFSLGTQNSFSYIKEPIVDYVFDKHEMVSFTFGNEGKRVESTISAHKLHTLKMNFYNYATCSRLFNNNFYLSFHDGKTEIHKEFSLLESVEKPLDSPNFLIQGNLESVCSESIKVNGYNTNYGFLSNTDNAFYLPENIGLELLSFFSLNNLNEIIFSDTESSVFQSKIEVKLKNKLDESFEYRCALRGFYSNRSFLSNQLTAIAKNDLPLAICSSSLFDNITFSENKLACFIKYNSANSEEFYYRFLDIIESCFQTNNYVLDFNVNTNEETTLFFHSKLETYIGFFPLYLKFIFTGIAIFFLVVITIIVVRLIKMPNFNIIINSIVFLSSFGLSFILHKSINFLPFILISDFSLFVITPFVFVILIVFFVKISNLFKGKKYDSDYCSIKI